MTGGAGSGDMARMLASPHVTARRYLQIRSPGRACSARRAPAAWRRIRRRPQTMSATARGHCILCHGFESGPDATKVTALSAVAEGLGWTQERPDFTDLDARRDVSQLGDVAARLQR